MTRWDKRDDMRVHEQEPYNAETDPAVLDASFITPTEAFYGRNHGPVPDVDATTWRLRVDGLVEHVLELGLDELGTRFERHEVTATMQCAGNRRTGLSAVADIPGEDPWDVAAIGTATWAGARLADVLAAAAPTAGATDVDLGAPDVSELASPTQTYGSSVPLTKAARPEVLLAWEMNGAPLPRVHGAPVRVVVPCYIGARSVKWVDRMTLLDHPSDNYFQATAYRIIAPDADPDRVGPGDGISLGPWSLNSAILQPVDGARIGRGRHTVSGYAVAAEHRHVARVEVSTDGGRTWRDADLGPAQEWTWRRWQLEVELGNGPVDLVARAWDDSGAQQPSDPAALWNPKGYANTSWARVSVEVG